MGSYRDDFEVGRGGGLVGGVQGADEEVGVDFDEMIVAECLGEVGA